MNSSNINQFGWLNRPQEVERILQSLPHPTFSAAASHLLGTGDGKVVLLYEAVRKVWGREFDQTAQKIGDCFDGLTQVLMWNGCRKAIKDIKTGDFVITHNNRIRMVTDTIQKKYSGYLYEIKPKGHFDSVKSTADHKYLVYKNNSLYEYQWKQINELNKEEDSLLIPFVSKEVSYNHVWFEDRKIEVDENFAFIVGWYLAEGGSSGKSLKDGSENFQKVTFNLGIDEEVEADQIIEKLLKVFNVIGKKYYHKADHNSLLVEVHNSSFAKFIKKLVPGNVYTKRVPQVILFGPEPVKLTCLKAWISGDGHVNTSGSQIVSTSVSHEMIKDFYHLSVSCNLCPYVYKHKREDRQDVDAWTIRYNGFSTKVILERETPQRHQVRFSNLGLIKEIDSLSSGYVTDLDVYCLEVDEDHSFIANGVAVSNCVSWGFSRAVDISACVDVLAGDAEEHSWDLRTCTEAVYALSRVEYGDLDGSYEDGSVGAWAAAAVTKGGTLSRKKLGEYNPQRAKEWGAKGLPNDLEAEAREHTIKTASLVSSWDELKAAIANGYPVPVCSMQGFSLTRDSKGRCRPEGTWAHCMCFVGYRDDGWSAALVANSWGPDSPSGPKGDINIPGNCWWVDAATVNYMLRQRDSFALSSFNGYPKRNIDIPWVFA